MIQEKLKEAAENYGQRKTADKDMQVAFASSFYEGARWGYEQGITSILEALRIRINCTKDNHSEEMPWVWIIYTGRSAGSNTYYFHEKNGEAKTYDDAFEQAMQWTLKNLI